MPATAPRISRAALADVMEDLTPAIQRAAGTETRFRGACLHDAVQEASLAAIEAIHTFDPARGSLEPRVMFVVHRRLSEHRRRFARRKFNLTQVDWPTCPETGESRDVPDPRPAPFRLSEFLEELSEDARTVVRLLLESDALDAAVAASPPTPAGLRRAVRRYARGMGWASDRVTETFEEIGRVLA